MFDKDLGKKYNLYSQDECNFVKHKELRMKRGASLLISLAVLLLFASLRTYCMSLVLQD